MRYRDILRETTEPLVNLFEVRAHELYHATSVDNFYEMLEDDIIKPNTSHPITHTGGEKRSRHWGLRPSDVTPNGYLTGVSLTRNRVFARAWKSGGILMVLDGDLIKRHLRLFPIAFFGGRRTVADEAEEFVPGAIKPLSKFLIRVECSRETLEANSYLQDLDTLFRWAPPLVVNGRLWKNTGLDKGQIVR